MVTTEDLKQLAVDRVPADGSVAPPPTRVIVRYVLPCLILFGFIGMVAWASRDRWLLSTPVSVVGVIVSRAEIQQTGTPLFQAPAWVEPRPTPVIVSAMAEGVIESLLVVEGQTVKKGDPLAKLVDAEAKLTVRQAETEIRRRAAVLATAQAESQAAQSRFRQPVHLDSSVAKVETTLAQVESQRARLPAQIEAGEARLRFAEADLEGKQQAADAISERMVQQALSQRDTAQAELTELQQKGPLLDREIEALRRELESFRSQRKLLVEEKRRVAEAEASVELARADLEQAELSLELAKLGLDRMTVRSPMDGKVLQLVARPGGRVLGLSPNSLQDSSTVATLYDPSRLQVRADVRLEDVPQVVLGQRVIVETPSASAPIDGRVLAITSVANIQKNTLEVKVELVDPPSTIRPEMLTTSTFLASEITGDATPESFPERILVPRQLVEGTGEEARIWIVDAGGLARKKSVRVGRATSGELVEIVSGIEATDKLITNGRELLDDGDRVRIVSEDSSIGMNEWTASR